MEEEVLEMLKKGAIQKVVPTEGPFLSKYFLVEKEDTGNHPFKKLQNFIKFIPYKHFKVEDRHC